MIPPVQVAPHNCFLKRKKSKLIPGSPLILFSIIFVLWCKYRGASTGDQASKHTHSIGAFPDAVSPSVVGAADMHEDLEKGRSAEAHRQRKNHSDSQRTASAISRKASKSRGRTLKKAGTRSTGLDNSSYDMFTGAADRSAEASSSADFTRKEGGRSIRNEPPGLQHGNPMYVNNQHESAGLSESFSGNRENPDQSESSRSRPAQEHLPGSPTQGLENAPPASSSCLNAFSRAQEPSPISAATEPCPAGDSSVVPNNTGTGEQNPSTNATGSLEAQGSLADPNFVFVAGKQYDVHDLLGRGGFGEVHKVSVETDVIGKECADESEQACPPEKKFFALKCVKSRNEKEFESIRGEISMMEKLKGNPHIIQIHASEEFVSSGIIVIVMELGICDFKQRMKARAANNDLLNLAEISRYWVFIFK